MNIAEARELYIFLRGRGPKGFRLPDRPRLGKRAAFAVLYVLRERFHLIPDTFEQCDGCLELFNRAEGGRYDEKTDRYFCVSCEAHL